MVSYMSEDKDKKDLSDSQLKIVELSNKIDDVRELFDTILKGIISLKWYHLFYIGFFFSLGLGWVFFNWVLSPDNRSVLLNIAGRSRIVGFVDNCGVIKVPYNGEVVHAVFLTYQTQEHESRYIVTLVPNYDTKNIKAKCKGLYKDRQDLIHNRKDLEKTQINSGLPNGNLVELP